ncbi:hypothetical protein NKG05_29185 [Oerskovia sp. M15]
MQPTAWHAHERAALVHALTQAAPTVRPSARDGGPVTSRHTWSCASTGRGRRRARVRAAARLDRGQGPGTRRDGARTGRVRRAAGARRAGPAAWSPWSWAGNIVNLTEHYVHTEDARRGAWSAGPAPAPGS